MSDNPPPLSLADQKLRAEIEKLEVEIAVARRSVALERLKAWGTLLAPVATAFTIIAAIWIGIAQLDSKRDEDEDQAWRETVKALGDRSTDPATASTLLQPFLKSPRYHISAVAAAVHALPGLRNEEIFRELTAAAFDFPKSADFTGILTVERKLSDTLNCMTDKIDNFADTPREACETEAEVAVSAKPPVPSGSATAAKDDAKALEAAKLQRSIVDRELSLLCSPIAYELGRYPHRVLAQAVNQTDIADQAVGDIIDMKRLNFNRCDFSGVDLRDVDFGNSMFFRVKLDRAKIGRIPVVFDNGTHNDNIWGGIVWWTAKYIEPRTLQKLVQEYKPFQSHGGTAYSYRDDESFTEDDWKSDVRRLCRSAGIQCPDAAIQLPPVPPKP